MVVTEADRPGAMRRTCAVLTLASPDALAQTAPGTVHARAHAAVGPGGAAGW